VNVPAQADLVLDLRATEHWAPTDAEPGPQRFLALVDLARGLVECGVTRHLVVALRGGLAVAGEDPIDPQVAALVGAVQCIEQEHPALRCSAIDMGTGLGLATTWADRLLAQAEDTGVDRLVAWRGAQRWVRDYLLLENWPAPRLPEGGVYLITGGLGSVGLRVARALAQRVRGARLVLCSRGGSLDPAQAAALVAAGALVQVAHADVADEVSMSRLLADVTARHGALDGVVHAAGDTDPGRIFREMSRIDEEQALSLWRARVGGARVLERLLADHPRCRCVLVSSNAATLGGLGLGAYAAACHALDAVAARNRAAGRPWISSNWDGWPARDGSVEPRRAGIERYTMDAGSAERVFMAVLGCEAERVVVAGGDLQHRLASWQGSRQGGQRGGQVGVADAASPTESRSAVEPRFDATADEAAVAAAFAAVLGVTPLDSRVDFFALGGDSLLGSRMLARLARDHGLTLPLRSLFEGASVAQIAARLREARSASLAGSRSDASRLAVQVVPATIPRQPPAASHHLSSTQRRLWLLHQFSPDSSAWNVPLHQRLDGALDRVALEAAFRALQERHDILRTRFMGGDRDGEADTWGGQDNGPRQVVDAVPGAVIQWMDLSDLPSDAAQARVDELAQAQARQPFDLARGPLVRALLVRLAPQRHVLLVTAHHIVCDGVSLGVIGLDLSALYRSALEGRQPALPPLPLQYRDFAAWHNAYLESQEGRRDRDFWLQQLAGPLPVLDLVDDLPRPPLRTHAGAEALWRIPRDTTAALGALAARSQASLFMVLLAALNALLHRYSGATDIIVGSPAAGRPHADLEDQVGCYLNTLVLRNPVDPAQGFSGLLTQVAANAAQAYEHQAYPFEELVAQLQAGRDPSRSPVFDVMLILQNDVEDVLQLPGIQALPCFGHNGSSKLDLSFNFKRLDGQLLLGLEYNLDLFTRERIEALGEHLVNLLAAVARDPSQAVGDIPLASFAELARIAAFNRTATDWPAQLTLVDAFEQQAARQPQAMAVRCGPLSLTYEALAGRALAIARRLTGCGVAHGDILVLALDSGPDLLAALLATFRVGAAAVLTERPLPPRRLEAMLAQSGAHALLVDRAADPPLAPVTHIALDAPAPAAVANVPPPPRPEDAALVFFTSGSTGVPRGVPLSHRAIVNELDWFRRFFALGPQDVLPQKTVLTFVDCIVELLLPVTFTGGCSVLRPQYELARDLPALWDWCAAERASLLQLVPVVFDALRAEVDLAAVPSLRTLVLSGAAPPRLPRMPFRIFNLYGCSESTSLSSWYEMTEPVPLARVPIGWPLQNTQLHVLDERMRPCPLFVPGEVYIGGVMLSAGYLGDAAQTAARFVLDPTAAGARLFRTGDLGRRLADGSIDYLGRCDDQVKIRGIRIECGEVEAALRQCPGVQEVVVAAHAPADAETVLVAYLAGHEGELDAGLLRQQLVQQLPPAMLPAAFVQLPALPRTSSGKIDKRALPALPVAAAAGERVPPRNEFEARIAAIWCEVLQLPDVGIRDDFILLGGHSLRAVRVAARLARELQREVGITDILRYPRIDQLAPVLAARPVMAQAGIGAAAPVIAPISPEELDLLK
jgi:amino acid adenylation domain-containing protein